MEDGLKKAGIYIHIPFCKKKCAYCSFISVCDISHVESYFNMLYIQLKNAKQQLKDYLVDTVYFGGGTPSFVNSKYICKTIETLNNIANVDKNAEISIEGNPESITKDKLKDYFLSGVNRISIGVQSFCNDKLKTLGRLHTAEDFEKALYNSFDVGFTNISCDIMLGLPSQTMENVKSDALRASKYDIKHISAYGLKAEEGTKLYDDIYKNKNLTLPDGDTGADMYTLATEVFKENGFDMYEVSNFCKKGYECKHNLKYWQRQEYLGFGLSAHSFFDDKRFSCTSSLDEYLMGKGHIQNVEIISAKEAEFEYIMLNFRLKKGIDRKIFKKLFGSDIIGKYAMVFNKYKSFYNITDNFVSVNFEGFMVLNRLLSEFLI